MLKHNLRQNLQPVVQAAIKYSDLLGPARLIDLLERYKTAEGLFYYLGSIVNVSRGPRRALQVHRGRRQVGPSSPRSSASAATATSTTPRRSRTSSRRPSSLSSCRSSSCATASTSSTTWSCTCIRTNTSSPSRSTSSASTPPALPPSSGGLLDVDCDEGPHPQPARHRQPRLRAHRRVGGRGSRPATASSCCCPFLEATLAAGNQQRAVYNALAKIYIDSNNNPEKFLKENDQYDSLVVGKYCEKRDPNLAYLAYSKGQNDLELCQRSPTRTPCTRAQARYLLARADRELWMFVLSENNIHRRSVVDQVIATAPCPSPPTRPRCPRPSRASSTPTCPPS